MIVFIMVGLTSCEAPEGSRNKLKGPPKPENFVPALGLKARKLQGQSVYVPIYSSIHNRHEGELLDLSGTLSLRNTSLKEKIIVHAIDYYDTNGKKLKSFIDRSFSLGEMSSKEYVIPSKDLSGGVGANFIVTWDAEKKVSTPVIEAIMVGEFGTKAFAFRSEGREIEAH